MIGTLKSVDIVPGVNILSVFQYLNYKSWYALAEFVDNSLQSAIDNATILREIDGPKYQLRVGVAFDDDHNIIVIEDNAAGINVQDFARALKTAELPPDRSGLSEFGVGLKSAAFWFSKNWSVETSALGESVERKVTFDLKSIVDGAIGQLPVLEKPADRDSHYTRITLRDVYRMPRGRTLGKVRSHLESIYRSFIRDKVLLLMIDGRKAEYREVPVLVAPPAWESHSETCTWKKGINFDFGDDLSACGFAAIRERGSTSEAGFALFRRGRLIEGSSDEPYRPELIFGRGNSFRSQRLFGELELTGFEVTHTKDGFNWGENEAAFLDLLAEELNQAPLSLLRQADEFRVKKSALWDHPGGEAQETTSDPMADDDRTENYREPEDDVPVADAGTVEEGCEPTEEPCLAARETVEFNHAGEVWVADVELDDTLPNGDLYTVQQEAFNDSAVQRCVVRVNYSHPFLAQFTGRLSGITKLFAALGVAENSTRMTGSVMPGSIRRTLNGLLKDQEGS